MSDKVFPQWQMQIAMRYTLRSLSQQSFCHGHPQDLQRESTQATEYAMQLLAMLDAAVQAASSGTHIEAFLEVCTGHLCRTITIG